MNEWDIDIPPIPEGAESGFYEGIIIGMGLTFLIMIILFCYYEK
jgi:hypothetical protein